MTIMEMLGQSGLLTALGMGVVFSFIIILIICMGLLQKVLHLLGLDKIQKKDTPKNNVTAATEPNLPQTDTKKIVAAIAMALKKRSE